MPSWLTPDSPPPDSSPPDSHHPYPPQANARMAACRMDLTRASHRHEVPAVEGPPPSPPHVHLGPMPRCPAASPLCGALLVACLCAASLAGLGTRGPRAAAHVGGHVGPRAAGCTGGVAVQPRPGDTQAQGGLGHGAGVRDQGCWQRPLVGVPPCAAPPAAHPGCQVRGLLLETERYCASTARAMRMLGRVAARRRRGEVQAALRGWQEHHTGAQMRYLAQCLVGIGLSSPGCPTLPHVF